MKFIHGLASNRKLIVGVVLLILIVIVNIALIAVIFKINQDEVPSKIRDVQAEYKSVLLKNTGLKELPPRIVKDFDVINSASKSDEEKYQALLDLTDAFRSGYSKDHTPEARLFIIKKLDPYAKENFPDLYVHDNFDIPCLDPTCGATINNELQNIIDIIKNTDLISTPENKENDEYFREVILDNLTNMALLNESGEQFEIISLGSLVINQLEREKENYSEPSKLLKEYMLKKYNYDYDKFIEEQKNAQIK